MQDKEEYAHKQATVSSFTTCRRQQWPCLNAEQVTHPLSRVRFRVSATSGMGWRGRPAHDRTYY